PLGDDLLAVKEFTLELLPVSLRSWVEDITDRMQVPLDFPSNASVVALAGCVNRRALVRPKREDTSWKVVPNLWGGNIGPPGFLKSPVMKAVTWPLVYIEEMWRKEHRLAAEEYELEKERAELKDQAWREECKKAFKKNAEPPIRPDKSFVRPAEKRLL